MPMEKTFDAAEAEARIYAAWEAAGAFRAGANARPGADSFCIMIPPPNVTGSLHMGHAFNNTLQDILTRWHRMRGFDTLWQPGTDHAGIATQMVTEREMAAHAEPTRREMGREAFIRRVWAQKQKSRGTIIGQLKRLGASCDWDREAFTMSGAPGAPAGEGGNFHDAVIRVFVDLYGKGLIYRGKRLVNWDPHFETAISDLEVEQVEVDGHLWRLRYRLADGVTYQHPVEFNEEGEPTRFETRDYLVVATTRPETMLGDTGVAVNPDDARYARLVGRDLILPLVGRRIPIVADAYADPAKGTGAVKITPAHDFNDWDVGERCGLRAINVMTTRAAMHLRENADFLADAQPSEAALALDGLDRYDARREVVRLAEEGHWLDGIDADRHMVPHGDRSKVAIEPYLTDQWFVDTARIVQPALDAVRDGRTTITPLSGERTYFHWLENIEPWCISRQLWWGHQVPVWYDADGTPYCAPTEAEARAMAGGRALTRDPDVLDTWFSSGLWPIGTLGWPEDTPEMRRYFPTSVLVTGFDILFFWVARMMMMQLAVMGEVPFHAVYLHGLVRDARGKKMSKSLGNVIDPLEIIDQYGADALRFASASMASLGGELKLDTTRFAGYRNFGTKLWNATRFAEMNGVFDASVPAGKIPAATLTANRWILTETARARMAVDAALAEYRFNDAASTLYSFVWGKVCDWYVEFAKPLMDGEGAAETRATMRWVLDQCQILLHPIMPFVTEELWGLTAPAGGRAKMLIHADWPTYGEDLVDTEADREMNWVIGVIEEIRSARAEMRVPVGLKLHLVIVGLDARGRAAWDRNLPMIARLARLDTVAEGAAPKGSVTIAVEGGTLALPLEGVIDIAAEQARLSKGLDKLGKDIGGLRGRLANPKFMASAPEEVVEETRGQLAAAEDEAGRLEAALRRLAEAG